MKWFKREGLILKPASIPAWIIFFAGLGYAIYSFIEIDSKSHSVSDTLMNFAFRFLIIFAVYTFIGYLSSSPDIEK